MFFWADVPPTGKISSSLPAGWRQSDDVEMMSQTRGPGQSVCGGLAVHRDASWTLMRGAPRCEGALFAHLVGPPAADSGVRGCRQACRLTVASLLSDQQDRRRCSLSSAARCKKYRRRPNRTESSEISVCVLQVVQLVLQQRLTCLARGRPV